MSEPSSLFVRLHLTPEAREACGAQIDAWCEDGRFPGNVAIKTTDETWTLSFVEFSENYGEMIIFLSILRAATPFVTPGTRSVAVVHDYLWGDTETDVAIEITPEASRILDTPLAEDITEARAHLDQHVRTLEQD